MDSRFNPGCCRRGLVASITLGLATALLIAAFPAAAEVVFVRALDANGDKKALRGIAALRFDAAGRLQAIDDGKLRLEGADGTLTALPLSGKDGLFRSSDVSGLAAAAGALALVNADDNLVVIRDASGKAQHRFGASSGAAKLSSPRGIAHSASGRFYIADRGRDRVAVFGADGVYLSDFGNAGDDKLRLDSPFQVEVDGAENVYVLDRRNGGRLSVYDARGRVLGQVEGKGLAGRGERDPELSALAVDRNGHVVVADSGNGKVYEVDWRARQVVQSFGSRGDGRGQFKKISAVALADDGQLAIGDSGIQKIEVYRLGLAPRDTVTTDPQPNVKSARSVSLECTRAYAMADGAYLCLNRDKRTAALHGADGKPRVAMADKLDEPVAAAFDREIVALVDDNSFKVFARDGRLRFKVGRRGSDDGQFRDPQAIALHGNRIYVADAGNDRVQVFSRDGVFLQKFENAKGQPPRFKRPAALAVDGADNVYIADKDTRRVNVFAPKGDLLYALGGDDKSPDRFEGIEDIAVDGDDNLYVLGSVPGNSRVVRVFAGPTRVFEFGAETEDNTGFREPVSLSVVSQRKTTIAVYDRKPRALKEFSYLQIPGRVGGVVVEGDVTQTALRWQKAPGSYIELYRIYGAASESGPYQAVADARDNSAVIRHQDGTRHAWFRVAAVSGFGVEGLASTARLDGFQPGYQAFQDKRYADAESILRKTLEANPDHASAVEYLGRSLVALGRHDDAVQQFDHLAGLPGRDVHAAQLKAEALLQAGDFVRARAALDKVLAGARATPALHVLCGEISLKLGDAIGAVTCLEKALAQTPDDVRTHFLLGQAYVGVGVVDKGLGEYDKAVKLDEKNVDAWVEAGRAFQTLGRHDGAVQRFEKALALEPLNTGARVGAARSYLALKQLAKSRSIALAMAGQAGQEAEGNYLIGVIALAEKRNNEALLSLSKATATAPDNAEAWSALADVFERLKNTDKAIEALQRATRAAPGNYDAHRRLGELERQRGNNAAAIASLERAVALRPGEHAIQLLLAQSLFDAQQYQDVIRYASEAARLDKDNTEPLELMAEAANRQGKSGDAIDYLQRAIKLKKSDSDLHLRLGRIYTENNLYDLAQQSLERAGVLAPKSPAPKIALGQLLMEKRDYDAAIKVLAAAVKLRPDADTRLLLNAAYAEKKKSLEFRDNAPRIVLENLKLERLFSSAYKQYAGSPIGTVTIRNLSGAEYKNLSLSFHIKDYMDFPVTRDIAALAPKATEEVPLLASFNNKILGLDEDTGVQVQLKLGFFRDGKRDTIELTQPITIYGKNAIVWARPHMVGAFVTPKDAVMRDFVRQGANAYRVENGPLNPNLVSAMTVFNLLSAHGIHYQVDPNNPYSKLDADQVDYVQYPRETLKLKSGDCDDLSVAFNAALENLGIETAFVDVPGHLFLLFNTGLDAKDRGAISLDDGLSVLVDGKVWIPLEATMIGTSFTEAWAEGARKYREFDGKKQLKLIPTKTAWAEYLPVTLSAQDAAIELPAAARVTPLMARERSQLIARSLDRLVQPYRAMAAADAGNLEPRQQVAIIYARYGLYAEAFRELDEILQRDPANAAAHNNRGNIFLSREDFDRALEAYQYAERLDPTDGGVKLNMAMAYYKLGRGREASEKYREATVLNRDIATRYEAFGRLLVQ
jgi:tetratricopeptide (TPR) repeat protein/DNA-binding beta-propeller fold protein YncE